MSTAPYTPVTLKVIKEALAQSPDARILNFLYQGGDSNVIEEAASLLAQEFDKELGITPLMTQGALGLDDLSSAQMSGQQVIIVTPISHDCYDDDDGVSNIFHMRRGLEHSRAMDTVRLCRNSLVILLQGYRYGYGVDNGVYLDLGQKSLFVSDMVLRVNHDKVAVERYHSTSTPRETLPIHNLINGLLA